MQAILGRKVGMTQVFDQTGNRVVVTVVEAGPCAVVRKWGEGAQTTVQLAFDECREKSLNKPKVGLFAKRGLKPHRFLKEFIVGGSSSYTEGESVDSTLFKSGDFVDVSGTSKGSGFTGVMQRHNFGGAKRSHGVHEYFRHGGSIGCSATPARVFRGKKMPGQHGNAHATVQNLQVMLVLKKRNLILVKGAIPGPKGGVVELRSAVKKHARPTEAVS